MGASVEVLLASQQQQPFGSNMVSDNNTSEELQFPAGLRVLAVDDDRICLRVLEKLLRKCLYRVTTCLRAVDALKLLRENRDGFDLVISDVHMPDMDGFKLLELVGLEMDLPVIMTSANGETRAVMRGIQHGACDYLLKPVRLEELKNIWQHVIRKKSKSSDDTLRADYGENHGNDGIDSAVKNSKKRKDGQDEDEENEQENEDPSTSKKPRVVWTVELHQKFVNAVHQLGINKAVPKRILQLMDVRGLTRENVASHLQKYRLYLRRISGVAHQTTPELIGYGGVDERYLRGASALGEFRNHMTCQTLIPPFQTGMLNNGGLKSPDRYFIPAVHGHAISSGLPNRGLTNRQANILNSSHGAALSALPGGSLEFNHGQITQLESNASAVLSALPRFTSVNMDNKFTTDNNMKINGNNLSMLVSDSTTRVENSFNSYAHVDTGLNSVAPCAITMDNRGYENPAQTMAYHNSMPSSIPSLQISGKYSIPSSSHISSAQNLVAGSATREKWDAWHGGSRCTQVTPIGTPQNPNGECNPPSIGTLQQQQGWVPKLENELNEDNDRKPFCNDQILAANGLKQDQINQLIPSTRAANDGGLIAHSLSADDLLACYMEQQQDDGWSAC